jgi:hypothetical protein
MGVLPFGTRANTQGKFQAIFYLMYFIIPPHHFTPLFFPSPFGDKLLGN